MSKGGSSTTKVEVPKYIEDAGKANLAKADLLAQIGYTPYYGPDVAAFTPMQQAAFQNTSDAASAFGMATPMSQQDVMGGMPAPTSYAGGVQGYSSAPMFEQSMAQLQERRPGQYEALNAPFINPYTGASPEYPYTGSTGQGNPFDEEAGSGGTGANNYNGGGEGRDAGYDSYGGGEGTGGGGSFRSGRISAALPGGVNDPNLGRPMNQAIARATTSTQSAPTASSRPVSRDQAGSDATGGCVVATHAVESGAFTPKMKREAVVWCMQALHGKWWGEAVRRGYRHLGRKKIEQGKAREHYAEFSRYIQFANGKKRDVRGAVTFALRTAQFFAVGLVKKDA